ncbi:MAG: anaerobic ribonucleoside-triphosphate reductase [Christensenellales bacterium]
MFENIKVIKRDGKKVDFDGTKIALAIKKGFDSINDESNKKYTENDVNKVYNLVINQIMALEVDKIKIEKIQDMIEEKLKDENYLDVFKSFSEYRERRAQSRRIFLEEKKQHKFLKALEDLTLKTSSNENENNTPLELMVDYGSTVSREFAKAYIVKKKMAELQESGEIHIHDLNFMPLGTTTTSQINLLSLFDEGFKAKNICIREPQNIMSYSALAVIAITLNQKEQHGCQSIPAFDYYMAPGVLKTFKKQFQETINDILAYTDLDKFAAINGIEREIERLETIKFDIAIFDKYSRESEQLKRVFRIAYESTLKKLEKAVVQAVEAFVHNINTIDSRGIKSKLYPSINIGTDISPEGRLITDKILDAIDYDSMSPVVIFKVKEGINFNKEDPNYDLYKKAIDVSSRRLYPNFSFLDSTYNKKFYVRNNPDREVAYNTMNMRVMDNIIDDDRAIASKRGLISYTTINLPRIGIKNNNNQSDNYESFFNELEEKMDIIKDQLLDRFEKQGNKKVHEFPFLIGEGILLDGERAKPEDKIRKVIKQSSMGIGFLGLEECLIALTGYTRTQNKQTKKLGLKIIDFMRNKVNEYSTKYNLNFVLIGVDDKKVSEEFMALDKAIYGKLEKITDKELYTESFYIPEGEKLEEKIEIESPYHELTNGGHIINLRLEEKNPEAVEAILKELKEKNVGYASVN